MQIAYSFDRETMRKIAKGFFHSLIVAVLLMALDFLAKIAGLVHFSDPIVASMYTVLSANLYNAGKEFVSGI